MQSYHITLQAEFKTKLLGDRSLKNLHNISSSSPKGSNSQTFQSLHKQYPQISGMSNCAPTIMFRELMPKGFTVTPQQYIQTI